MFDLKNINIVNLTPHTINLCGKEITSSGVARAIVTSEIIGNINEVPVRRNRYGSVEGLPNPEANTIFIVSALTAQACKDRDDVYMTDQAVRDDQGRITGCNGLARV